MSGFPAWTAWARDGSEHEFKLRVGQGGATTLHVDNGASVPVSSVRLVHPPQVDVTSYVGNGGKSFISAGLGTMVIDLPGGTLELEVTNRLTRRNPTGLTRQEDTFHGRVTEVQLETVNPYTGNPRTMRDSPASGDAVIPCESCSEEFPAAEMRYCADPYNAEINGDETEAWYCDSCLEDSRLSV